MLILLGFGKCFVLLRVNEVHVCVCVCVSPSCCHYAMLLLIDKLQIQTINVQVWAELLLQEEGRWGRKEGRERGREEGKRGGRGGGGAIYNPTDQALRHVTPHGC